MQDRNRHVHGEEQQQERLGRGEFCRGVLQRSPRGADAEGESKPQQVQHAPRACPCNRHDTGVEYGVVREQRDMVAAAGRQPDRRKKTGQHAQHRQCARILQHRQHAHTCDQHHADAQRRSGIEQAVQLEGREHRQQQATDGAALQRQRKPRPLRALRPTEDQTGQCQNADAGQAQLGRHAHPALIAGVLQQRRHARQQDQHADLDRHIALGEPTLQGAGRARDGAGRGRKPRRLRLCGLQLRRLGARRLRLRAGTFRRRACTARHRICRCLRRQWRRHRRGRPTNRLVIRSRRMRANVLTRCNGRAVPR